MNALATVEAVAKRIFRLPLGVPKWLVTANAIKWDLIVSEEYSQFIMMISSKNGACATPLESNNSPLWSLLQGLQAIKTDVLHIPNYFSLRNS